MPPIHRPPAGPGLLRWQTGPWHGVGDRHPLALALLVLLATAALHARARPTGGPTALADALPDADAEVWRYVVRPGDNPWRLATRELDGARRVAPLVRLNAIREPRRILPGTVLRIPQGWIARLPLGVVLWALHGEVTLQAPGAAAAPARAGERLAAGAVLRTAEGASAVLALDDGSRVLVRGESEVVLLEAERPRGAAVAARAGASAAAASAAAAGRPARWVRFDVLRGALENLVTPQVEPGRFEIRRENTAHATIAATVEAPQYRFEAPPPGRHSVRVRSIGDDGYEGPWGAPQSFDVPEPCARWWLLLVPLLVLAL